MTMGVTKIRMVSKLITERFEHENGRLYDEQDRVLRELQKRQAAESIDPAAQWRDQINDLRARLRAIVQEAAVIHDEMSEAGIVPKNDYQSRVDMKNSLVAVSLMTDFFDRSVSERHDAEVKEVYQAFREIGRYIDQERMNLQESVILDNIEDGRAFIERIPTMEDCLQGKVLPVPEAIKSLMVPTEDPDGEEG